MDKMVYTAMTGARHILEQQAVTANNLANATTTGFRAQLDAFRAVPLQGPGLATRTMVVDTTMGADFTQGSIQPTGRELDVALQGPGWITVQLEDGSEAYTRNGNLTLNENGVLQLQGGKQVSADGGTITIPPNTMLSIGRDGTVSGVSTATPGGAVTVLGRIKLVNPPPEQMVRGADGLFRLKDGSQADADANVRLVSGSLEASNVNVVNEMVSMISQARAFEMHMSLLKNAETNDSRAAQTLSMNG
jgi:flagellar basal-body rod protein FlgF